MTVVRFFALVLLAGITLPIRTQSPAPQQTATATGRCNVAINASGEATATVKVRFRGLAKNTAHVITLFALSILWMVRRRLMATAAVRPQLA